REKGIVESSASWSLQAQMVTAVLESWREPDHGIWEVRGKKQHFTQSKIMCWLALDRGIQALERIDLPGPREEWVREREAIRQDVQGNGVDSVTHCFVQDYDTTQVDAALLVIVQTGYLPVDDKRVVNAVHWVRDELADGHHVKRYGNQE